MIILSTSPLLSASSLESHAMNCLGLGIKIYTSAGALALNAHFRCGHVIEGQHLVMLSNCCHMSIVPRHTSHATCHASHVKRTTSNVTRHKSHVALQTPHTTRHQPKLATHRFKLGCARHSSHVTRHTSHVTRHTSHVTRHT